MTDVEGCFLDTCAVLDLTHGHAPAIAAVSPFNELFIAFAALGELVRGAHGATNSALEFARIEAWLDRAEIVGGDTETSFIYGEVIAELESRGRRIPTNDVWVAAVAIRMGRPLVSRDAHFARVGGLSWIGY
jgi:predicted nucleic acid-binding protein